MGIARARGIDISRGLRDLQIGLTINFRMGIVQARGVDMGYLFIQGGDVSPNMLRNVALVFGSRELNFLGSGDITMSINMALVFLSSEFELT